MKITNEHIGSWVSKQTWENNAIVRVTAVGERKILIDRGDGYEDVLLNDENFIVVRGKE